MRGELELLAEARWVVADGPKDRMLPQRSCDCRISTLQGIRSSAPFCRRATSSRIDGLLWSQFTVHSYPPRQEIRLAVQSRRRACFPLYPIGQLAT